MRKAMIVAVLIASLFTFGAAFAQTDTGTDPGTGTTGDQPGVTQQQDPIAPGDTTGDTTTADGTGSGNAGLWGLVGLLGLAGLMGRSRMAETREYGARTNRAA